MTVPATPLRRALRGLVLPLVLLALWEAASHAQLVDPRILPPLERVAATLADEVANGDLLFNLGASLARDVAGFAVGSLLGVALGLLLGLWPLADRLVSPTFNGVRQVAVLAWIPLISLWFGFGEAAKVVFIALAAVIPVTLNTYEGVRGVSAQLVEVADALRLGRRQRVAKLYLPAAAPSIMTGVHLALIYAWLASIAAEYFMTVGPGIGGLIIAGRERFQMELVMLGILVLGLVGFGINRLASLLERRLLRWRPA